MKTLRLWLLVFICLLSPACCGPAGYFTSAFAATCTGGANCQACSSCRYCKHCTAGGTCSQCRPDLYGSSQVDESISSSGGRVSVRSYRRKDGTVVRAHTGRRPGSGGSARSSGRGAGISFGDEPIMGVTPPLGHAVVEPPRFNTDVTASEPSWVRQQRLERQMLGQGQPKPAPAIPATFSGLCVGLSDGDTITVLYQQQPVRVRLYGIDTPESKQPFGARARQFTAAYAFQKPVTIYGKGMDRYGRVLGWVFVGRTCVNAELVKSGLAWWYRQYSPKETKLAQLESEARSAKRGLWADARAVAPWAWRSAKR